MHLWRRFRVPIVFTILFLLIFIFITSSLRYPHPLRPLQTIVISLTAPILKYLTILGRSVERAWQGYFYLVGVQQENQELKQRLQEIAGKEIQYQEARLAQERLEQLLDLKTQLAQPVTGARVIAYDPSFWFKCAIIDRGEAEGVKWGMPVLSGTGIVGRIIESYPHYAKVMFLIDRNSAVDAMIQRNRMRGILEGKGGNLCYLRYIPKNADVQPDDLILASGLGGIYPRGMALGKVTKIDKKKAGIFQEIEVTPMVDFANLEEVLVVTAVTPRLQK
ncbi:MAG: rod shape-determining protein MreC [Desulfobacca sp. 4484_104]|nr:MAG: rod shape-determining protein MreC [Desulfobacca sp. 4484_104]